MDRAKKTEENRMRKEELERRLAPRMVWDSTRLGTAIRTRRGYRSKPAVAKVKVPLTEAQDNAVGRAVRRRQNKRLRGWLPHNKR